jgi:hypothetical protein
MAPHRRSVIRFTGEASLDFRQKANSSLTGFPGKEKPGPQFDLSVSGQ